MGGGRPEKTDKERGVVNALPLGKGWVRRGTRRRFREGSEKNNTVVPEKKIKKEGGKRHRWNQLWREGGGRTLEKKKTKCRVTGKGNAFEGGPG